MNFDKILVDNRPMAVTRPKSFQKTGREKMGHEQDLSFEVEDRYNSASQ